MICHDMLIRQIRLSRRCLLIAATIDYAFTIFTPLIICRHVDGIAILFDTRHRHYALLRFFHAVSSRRATTLRFTAP